MLACFTSILKFETDDYTLLISTSILKQMIHIAHIYCYLERNNYTMFVVLQELGTDKNLYALVFGESVLNALDAETFLYSISF